MPRAKLSSKSQIVIPAEVRRRLGLEAGDVLNVEVEGEYILLRKQAEASDAFERLLEFVGLHSKRNLPAGSLSFGQQKLLEFAMALMNEPKALLLDEPTAGINPTLINGLIDRLKRANREFGITLFVIEHNMRVIMNLADHMYCMAFGQLLASGAPDEVKNDPRVLDAYLGAHA